MFNNVNTTVAGLTIDIANSTTGSKTLGNNGSKDADVESGEVTNFGFNLGGGCIILLTANNTSGTSSSNSTNAKMFSYLMFKNNKMLYKDTAVISTNIDARTKFLAVSYPLAARSVTANRGYGGVNIYQNRFAWLNYASGSYMSSVWYYDIIKLKYT